MRQQMLRRMMAARRRKPWTPALRFTRSVRRTVQSQIDTDTEWGIYYQSAETSTYIFAGGNVAAGMNGKRLRLDIDGVQTDTQAVDAAFYVPGNGDTWLRFPGNPFGLAGWMNVGSTLRVYA